MVREILTSAAGHNLTPGAVVRNMLAVSKGQPHQTCAVVTVDGPEIGLRCLQTGKQFLALACAVTPVSA
jgi:hypothetical protein